MHPPAAENRPFGGRTVGRQSRTIGGCGLTNAIWRPERYWAMLIGAASASSSAIRSWLTALVRSLMMVAVWLGLWASSSKTGVKNKLILSAPHDLRGADFWVLPRKLDQRRGGPIRQNVEGRRALHGKGWLSPRGSAGGVSNAVVVLDGQGRRGCGGGVGAMRGFPRHPRQRSDVFAGNEHGCARGTGISPSSTQEKAPANFTVRGGQGGGVRIG